MTSSEDAPRIPARPAPTRRAQVIVVVAAALASFLLWSVGPVVWGLGPVLVLVGYAVHDRGAPQGRWILLAGLGLTMGFVVQVAISVVGSVVG